MGISLSQKDRRHSGWVTPRRTLMMNQNEMINEALEPQDFWDDWEDYRDGQRGSRDKKLLRNKYMRYADYFNVKKWNARLRKLINRRKLRKEKIRDKLTRTFNH